MRRTSAILLLLLSAYSHAAAPPAVFEGDALARLGSLNWRHGSGDGVAVCDPSGTLLATLRDDFREVVVRTLPEGRVVARHEVGRSDSWTPLRPRFAAGGSLFLIDRGRWFLVEPRATRPARVTHRDTLADAEPSADGRLMLLQEQDLGVATFVLLDARSGRAVGRIGPLERNAEPRTHAISPDGRTAAVALGDGRLVLLDLAARRVDRATPLPAFRDIRGHESRIVFLNASERVAVVEEDRVVVADTRTGRILADLDVAEGTGTVTWWPVRGCFVALTAEGGLIERAPEASGWSPLKPTGEGQPFYLARVEKGRLRVYDCRTGAEVGHRGDDRPAVSALYPQRAGGVIVRRADGSADRWTPRTGEVVVGAEEGRPESAVSPSGRLTIVRDDAGEIILHGPGLGEARSLGVGHCPEAADAAFSEDERRVAVVLVGAAAVVDTRTGRTCVRLGGVDATRAVLSPDGRRLACVCGRTGGIVVYETASGRELRRMDDHDASQLAFSPDGRRLAVAGRGVVYEYDLRTRARPRELYSRDDGFAWGDDETPVSRVAYSPVGSLLAAVAGREVRLYRAADGECERVYRGAETAVRALAFSRDGGLLYAGCGDGTVTAWAVGRSRGDQP